MSSRAQRSSYVFVLFFVFSGLLFVPGGCHRRQTGSRATAIAVKEKLSETADWGEKRRQGIDFVAIGTPPAGTSASAGWRLDIDFSRQIVFRQPGGTDLVLPMPKPQPTGKGMGVLLDARSAPAYASNRRAGGRTGAKASRVKISIEPVTCRDPLTKRDYAYTVRVEADGKRYLGCGAFIKGSDRLNGEWVLETFRGQRLRPDQFSDQKMPFLAINLDGSQLTGSTGWNKIKGDIHADGDHLVIDPKVTTRKAGASSFENDFLQALRQASLFRIGKDRLTLLVNGQYAMTLRKKTA